MARHELLGGLIQVYRRTGRYWHCSASIDGHQHRSTTGEEDLSLAKQFAEDWFIGLRGTAWAGLLVNEKSFRQAADQFLKEYEVITEGQRSKLGGRLRDPAAPAPVAVPRQYGPVDDHPGQSAGISCAPDHNV